MVRGTRWPSRLVDVRNRDRPCPRANSAPQGAEPRTSPGSSSRRAPPRRRWCAEAPHACCANSWTGADNDAYGDKAYGVGGGSRALRVRRRARAGRGADLGLSRGPHLILGKHNYVMKFTAGEIARRLGKTLVAPVMAYVPEGNLDPPTSHMWGAGTITLPPEHFGKVV